MSQDDLKKNLPYIAIIVVLLGASVFFGFMFFKSSKTQANQASASQNNFGPGGGWLGQGGSQGSGARGGRGNFNPVEGTIQSIDSSVITMTKSDNTTQKINYTSSTRISDQSSGQRVTLAISDLKTGDAITVMGSVNGDAIDARMIFKGQFTPGQRDSYGGQGGGSSAPDNSSSDNSNNNSSDNSI